MKTQKKLLESQNVWRIKEFKQAQTVVTKVTNLAIGAQESKFKSKGGLEKRKMETKDRGENLNQKDD